MKLLSVGLCILFRFIGHHPSLVMGLASNSPRVGVIGAGAAGLAAARVISREGWTPILLEKDLQGGGVWRYVPQAKDRPMYQGLRTNLPKELMAFREFPFQSDITESYITHKQVQDYLMNYKSHFDLDKYIKYGCQVEHLKVLNEISRLAPANDPWPAMQLDWRNIETGEMHSQVFDAILVCNGHYAAPSFPKIPGLDSFKGRIVHSIEYDEPTIYTGQTVVCIGGRASGVDLAREISHHANHVYLSDTTCNEVQMDGKVTLVPQTLRINADGSIKFDGDCAVSPNDVDTIIFCSGYDYSFPFINQDSDLEFETGQRRVTPILDQLWHAQYPSLAFIGLPHSVVPFPLFEFQVEAVCAQWTNCRLPPVDQRLLAARQDAMGGGPQNTRVQDTHYLGDFQWDYCRKMAQWAGIQGVEGYIQTNQEMYTHSGQTRKSGTPGGPDTYRSFQYRRPTWDSWQVLPLHDEVVLGSTIV